MDKMGDFRIFKYRDHHIICNTKGDDSHHTHIKSIDTCKMLVKLVCKCQVPTSKYLRESAKRISRNEKYIQNIEVKQIKDSNKQKYYNVNIGKR